jgi:hypothetical protein
MSDNLQFVGHSSHFKGGREYSAENRMSGRKAPTEIVKSGISAGPGGQVAHYQITGVRWSTGRAGGTKLTPPSCHPRG